MRPSLKLIALGCAALSLTAFAQFTPKSYDTPSYVQFSNPRYEVTETETNAVITVVRTGDYRKTAEVGYSTVEGTAGENVDFEARGGTLVFASGQSIKTITIPILREEPAVQAKTFSVQLSDPGFDTVVVMASAEVEIKPLPPSLGIELAGGELVISWKDVGLPFILEAQTEGSWSAATGETTLVENTFLARLKPDAHVTLFRLRLE